MRKLWTLEPSGLVEGTEIASELGQHIYHTRAPIHADPVTASQSSNSHSPHQLAFNDINIFQGSAVLFHL